MPSSRSRAENRDSPCFASARRPPRARCRAEPENVVAAIGHLFERKTAFEKWNLPRVPIELETLRLVPRQGPQVFEEPRVLRAVERDVEVVCAVALIVTRFPVHL